MTFKSAQDTTRPSTQHRGDLAAREEQRAEIKDKRQEIGEEGEGEGTKEKGERGQGRGGQETWDNGLSLAREKTDTLSRTRGH